MWYVLLVGSYDQCYIGPFETRSAAEQFADDVERGTDAYIETADQRAQEQVIYGTAPTCPPAARAT